MSLSPRFIATANWACDMLLTEQTTQLILADSWVQLASCKLNKLW